ncbi:MAG: ammonium transporter, partial [Actinomycetota bacterium]
AFAAASGGIGGMATSWLMGKKPDVSMAGNGILAGLVAICSGIGEFSAFGTIITGFVAGVLVVFSVLAIERAGIDDPVGAFSVHGLCGFWGLLATGLFATTTPVNGAEESAGLLYGGGASLFIDQLVGGLVIAVFVLVTAGILFSGLKAAGLLRVSAEEETAGLDVSEHGSPGYGPDILAASSSI